jgi:APA family basic amino acid/polyamine antiporter
VSEPVEDSLRRNVGLAGLVLYGMGTTIGAGIYALTGKLAGTAGMAAPLSFVAASGLAGLTALCFAELSGRLPRAGGEAVYVGEGFQSPKLALGIGILTILAGVISAATVTVGFAGYLDSFVRIPHVVTVWALVVLLAGVSMWGIRETVFVAGLMTLVEIGGLLLIIVAGGDRLAELPTRAHEIWPAGSAGWSATLSAAVIAFYAFLGFEDMVNVAEEVRDVRRTLARGILWTLGLTTFFYLVITTIAVLVVPPAELAASSAPLALVYERCGGAPGVLAAIALFAMLNGALVQVVKSSRILYGLARMGHLPKLLGQLHHERRTPWLATLLACVAVGVLGSGFDLATLASATSLITLLTFSLADLALVFLKRRSPAPEGCFVVPTVVPIVGSVASVGLLAFDVMRRLA